MDSSFTGKRKSKPNIIQHFILSKNPIYGDLVKPGFVEVFVIGQNIL